MKPILLLIAALIAIPTIAADTYTPAPLQLLAQRVDEHDQQICDLDDRVRTLEQSQASGETERQTDPEEPRETVVRIVIDRTPPAAAPAITTPVVSPATPVITRRVATGQRRLKTADELKLAIKANYSGTVYADMSPKTPAWATLHLTTAAPDHRYVYQRSQLAGLSWNYLWNLHNLNHSPRAIDPYTTSAPLSPAIARVDEFVPTPRTPPTNTIPTGGCPNGRCPTAGSSNSRSRSSFWLPGKLLFGR